MAEEFTAKERLRFRKLLEVAASTTFAGERDAALHAATRIAAAYGMTLREAAGMAEEERPAARHRPRAHAPYPADFGAAERGTMGAWWTREAKHRPWTHTHPRTEAEHTAAEKQRHAEAMADAIRRGLDAEERAEAARKAARKSTYVRRSKRGAWRSRPEFVRVLLKETAMTAKEIASVAGVTIYDVFREKLLMR